MTGFEFLAYPWILYDNSGNEIARGDGTLFELPGATSAAQEQYYGSLRATGWSLCPSGFSVYARLFSSLWGSDRPGVLVLPGLRIKGGGGLVGKAKNLHVVSDKSVVVRHVDSVLDGLTLVDEKHEDSSSQLMHEIRGINTGIYHAALELQGSTAGLNQAISTNIMSLSQVLSARMDFVGFLTGVELPKSAYGKVKVYKKFDYMNRCFLPTVAKRTLTMALKGGSTSETYGPKSLLDLAAYLMVENAIKYAPRGSHIDVEVTENGSRINATVRSVGPRIDPDEVDLIFNSGFRGRNAIASGVPGSGIGLHALRRLVVDGFAGDLTISQQAASDRLGTDLSQVEFTATFPVAG